MFRQINNRHNSLTSGRVNMPLKSINQEGKYLLFQFVRGVYDRFADLFCMGIKNCRRLLKFHCYCYTSYIWDDWPIFMISASNELLQQQLEYTIQKHDFHSWWISKMQSGREDTLEERYAIKLCFKHGKMPQKRMECFRLLFDHLAWIEDQFLSNIRDSRRAGSLWGMMIGVGGVRESIDLSWLAKGLGSGLLCGGFKGVQGEIPLELASTLEIGSVAFPSGQCTSPQLHPCHRLFDEEGHQDPVIFGYSLSLEAVVMRQLRRWKWLWRRSLTRSHKRTSMGSSWSCWNGTTRALQPEEITSKGTRVSCVYYQ